MISGKPTRKAALARLLADVSDVTVAAAWAECASLTSRSLVYALSDPGRPNTPNDAQLRELADWARRVILRLQAGIDAIEGACDTMHTRAEDDAVRFYDCP